MDEQPTVTGVPAEPILAEVRAEFPDWQCAQGISGMFYAQHSATGTQVTGEDPLDLRDQIKAAEARRVCTEPGAAGPIYQAGQL